MGHVVPIKSPVGPVTLASVLSSGNVIKTIVTIDPGNNVSKNWEKSFKISEEIFKELNIKIIKFDEKDIKLAFHNT